MHADDREVVSGTLVRVLDPALNKPVMARVDGDDLIAVAGTIEELHHRQHQGEARPGGERLGNWRRFSLLPPTAPSKIVCVGLNYRRHAEEMNKDIPEEPLLFMKPPSALIGSGQAIELPEQSQEVHHEGELAIVMGELLRDGDAVAAGEAIFGYTCACDVTARDIQRREGRYTRGKGFDTFAPVGPSIALAADFEPGDHQVICRVDDQIRQQSRLDDFIFSIQEVVSFISHVMTLLPGDLIFTGTPAGVGPLHVGEMVSVEIDGIGRLENPVQRR